MNPDRERLWRHVRFLCEEIGPRLSGTPGAERAVAYVADRLRACGADVEVQDFPCPSWEHEATELTLLGDAGPEPLTALAQVFVGSCDVEAELASVCTWNELEFGPGLEGKALVLHGESAGRLNVDRNIWLLTAEERRAAALIVISQDETVSSKLTRDPRIGVPAVAVPLSVGRKLVANQGKRVRLKVRARPFGATGHNVIGRLPGEEEGHVVVVAHHDTAACCPGAADNASSVAALLEVCELLAPEAGRRLGIHFVTYGGHEYGRHKGNLGGVQYSRKHPADVAGARGVLEADCVGSAVGEARAIVAGWPPRQKEGLLAILRRVPQLNVNVRPDTEPPHTGIGLVGVPAVVLVDNWSSIPIHTAQDTLEMLTPDRLAAAASTMATVVRYLTSAEGARVT